jgi:hypothetical protein
MILTALDGRFGESEMANSTSAEGTNDVVVGQLRLAVSARVGQIPAKLDLKGTFKWRRVLQPVVKPRRWGLLILSLVVVILLTGAWVLTESSVPSGITCACPIGTALALAPPTESSGNGVHLYNFSVQSASSGVSWRDISPEIQTAGAGPVATTATGWNVTVFGFNQGPVGYYAIQSTGIWTVGGGIAVTSGQWLLLTSPGAASLSGDNLVVAFSGDFVGTISVAIP